VQLTPAIKAKAAELNYSPVKIYNWVRNNVEYVPTYGSIQGADLCLQTKQGNDFDIASLLIALLRASGIHARYVYGTIELPIERVMNWVGGFTSANAAVGFIASGGTPVAGIIAGGKISSVRMEHVWVEAFVKYYPLRGAAHKTGQGDSWIPLDASYKQYNFTQGIDIKSAAPFDAQTFVNQIQSTATIDEANSSVTNINSTYIQQQMQSYQEQVKNYIDQNYPNATVGDVLGKKEIIKQNFSFLAGTLPYQKAIIGIRYSEIPDSLRHKIDYTIMDTLLNEASLLYSAAIPQIAGKRITLSYVPATSDDQKVIDSYGDIYHVPAYMVNMKPQIKVEGNVVAIGGVCQLGYIQKLDMTFNEPRNIKDIVSNDLTIGGYYTLNIIANKLTISNGELIKKRAEEFKKYLENGGDRSKDDGLGEQLYLTALGYFYELDNLTNYISKYMGIEYTKVTSEGIVGLSFSIDLLYGIPTQLKPAGIYLDMDRNIYAPTPLNGDVTAIKQFMLAAGNIGSSLEHGIIEQLYGWNSISAVKAMYVANSLGYKIYRIDKFSNPSILQGLQISSEAKEDIINAVNAGKEVIVPENNIEINDWKGIGYIIRDTDTGAAGYLISGGLAGAANTETQDEVDIMGKAILVCITLIAIAGLIGEALHFLTVAFSAAALAGPLGWTLIPFILLVYVFIAIAVYILLEYTIKPLIENKSP